MSNPAAPAPTVDIDAIRKPNQTVAEATTTLTVTGRASYDLVLREGLRALGETTSSLFGYGIRQDGVTLDPRDTEPLTGELVVFAHRD